jgi:photosystem II stability/assembly factor-like uncharacterized protein
MLDEYQSNLRPWFRIWLSVTFVLLVSRINCMSQIEDLPGFPPSGVVALSFSSSSKGLVVGGSGDPWILRTMDSGSTWSKFSITSIQPKARVVTQTILDSTGYGWCVGDKLALRSSDNGLSWMQVGLDTNDTVVVELSRKRLYDVCTFLSSHVWIATKSPYLLYSNDTGRTWKRILIPGTELVDRYVLKVQFVSESHGWILSSFGKLYETIDGGVNWEQRGIPTWTYYRFRFLNDSIGVASYADRVSSTTDGGRTWENRFTTMETCTSIVSNGDRRVWCSVWDGVYSSFDGGKTWEFLSTLPKYRNVGGLSAGDSSTVYAMDHLGMLFRIINGGRTDTATSVVESGEDAIAGYFYFDRHSEKLRFVGMQEINHALVSNVLGDYQVSDTVANTDNSRSIDASSLSNGVYYVHYQVGDRWFTNGVTVVR